MRFHRHFDPRIILRLPLVAMLFYQKANTMYYVIITKRQVSQKTNANTLRVKILCFKSAFSTRFILCHNYKHEKLNRLDTFNFNDFKSLLNWHDKLTNCFISLLFVFQCLKSLDFKNSFLSLFPQTHDAKKYLSKVHIFTK